MPRHRLRVVAGIYAVALVAVVLAVRPATGVRPAVAPAPGSRGDSSRDQPVGRLVIPRIGVDEAIQQDFYIANEVGGIGWFPRSAHACGDGLAIIVASREASGAGLAHLRQLRAHDTLRLVTRRATCEYRVTRPPFVVGDNPAQIRSLLRPRPKPVLLLSACDTGDECARQRVLEAEGTLVVSRGPDPSPPPPSEFGFRDDSG